MNILIKGFYGYKNLGDELILFQLLNRVEDRFEPKKISIECGDKKWLEGWIIKHKNFLMPGIIKKLEFLPKPTGKEKIKICLGQKRGLYDLIIFGGGEVVDETRSCIYRGRNYYFMYNRDIQNGNTILVGGLGTNNKLGTKYLQDFLVKHAKFLLLRDKQSFQLVKNILESNGQNREEKAEYVGDLTYSLLCEAQTIFQEEKIKSDRNPYFLVNLSPNCDKDDSLREIKRFSDLYHQFQPIFIAGNKYEDQKFYADVLQILPNCELFDWTQSSITDILKLFYFAEAGIGARLHFLYILKFFKKHIQILNKSHKVEVNLSDLDEL